MSHRQLFNSKRIRQWQVKFYKNLDITLNFLKNINSKVMNQIVIIWSNRNLSNSFVNRLIELKNTKKIHKFSLLSILIIHCYSVCYLTIDISLRPTHISFDLDVLFVASRGPRNRSETTREISDESSVLNETTLTEYSLISWPIKLHSYPAPCQRPRIQRKVEVHCREGRPLPFYQAKGKSRVTSAPLLRFVKIRNVPGTRSAYRTRSLLGEDFFSFSLTGTLFTFRCDTTYRLILIIAPRRRDASNRLPTMSSRIQLRSIENRSTTTTNHC